MSEYRAPLADMRFAMQELAGLGSLSASIPAFESANPETAQTILEEAGRVAAEILSPLNRSGDRDGVRLEEGQVRVAPGFAEAFREFATGGWVGLTGSPEYGGQGLPHLVSSPVGEMWAAANSSFALCPELSGGAIVALEAHANNELRRLYLPKILSGEWTATMCLTEPQAGSELAAVQTRAEVDGDRYRLFGRKIFITWGDHDMTSNIVHLVLARAPNAPPGAKGISLFLVPKYRVNADGSVGERNDIRPTSTEHKLGLHASPTCVMALGDNDRDNDSDAGGAEGFLIGELHQGLPYMFTMMNHMRLGVGIQGIGLAQRAYQHAAAYARERIQGRSLDGKTRVPIVYHADVRRMLLTMRALTEASRALAYVAAAHLDRAHHASAEAQREQHLARADLLTPVVKAWGTEIAQEATSLAIQVHGGAGFIEETGVAQYARDARITTIYEGTNGIQGMDLIGRKLLRDGGRALADLLDEIRAFDAAFDAKTVAAGDSLAPMRRALAHGVQSVADTARFVIEGSKSDGHLPGAAAFNFLMQLAIVSGGWQMARAALICRQRLAGKAPDTDFYRAKLLTAAFYAEQIMPRAQAHADAVRSGSATTIAFQDDWF